MKKVVVGFLSANQRPSTIGGIVGTPRYSVKLQSLASDHAPHPPPRDFAVYADEPLRGRETSQPCTPANTEANTDIRTTTSHCGSSIRTLVISPQSPHSRFSGRSTPAAVRSSALEQLACVLFFGVGNAIAKAGGRVCTSCLQVVVPRGLFGILTALVAAWWCEGCAFV